MASLDKMVSIESVDKDEDVQLKDTSNESKLLDIPYNSKIDEDFPATKNGTEDGTGDKVLSDADKVLSDVKSYNADMSKEKEYEELYGPTISAIRREYITHQSNGLFDYYRSLIRYLEDSANNGKKVVEFRCRNNHKLYMIKQVLADRILSIVDDGDRRIVTLTTR